MPRVLLGGRFQGDSLSDGETQMLGARVFTRTVASRFVCLPGETYRLGIDCIIGPNAPLSRPSHTPRPATPHLNPRAARQSPKQANGRPNRGLLLVNHDLSSRLLSGQRNEGVPLSQRR